MRIGKGTLRLKVVESTMVESRLILTERKAIAATLLLPFVGWIGLFPIEETHAAAASIDVTCENPAQLDGRIQYCSQNEFAAESAKECQRKVVESIELAKRELNGFYQMADAGTISRQQFKFQHSASDYAQTQDKLNTLIDQITDNMLWVAEYPTVMLDDLDTSETSVPCYLKNYEVVKSVVEDLDQKITELKMTEAAIEALRSGSHRRDGEVSSLKENSVLAQVAQIGSGTSKNQASDVTGTLEDKAKRRKTPQVTALSGKMNAYSPQKAQSSQSQITEVFNVRPENQNKGSLASSTFGARATLINSNESAQRDSASVGGIFWKEPGSETAIELELLGEVQKPDANGLAGAVGVSGSHSARTSGSVENFSDSSEASSVASDSAVTSFVPSSPSSVGNGASLTTNLASNTQADIAPATSDESIFEQVTRRYQSTALFRRARVTSVPLMSFESRLQR